MSPPRGMGGSDLDSSEMVTPLFGTWADSLVMARVFDKGDEFPFVLPQV